MRIVTYLGFGGGISRHLKDTIKSNSRYFENYRIGQVDGPNIVKGVANGEKYRSKTRSSIEELHPDRRELEILFFANREYFSNGEDLLSDEELLHDTERSFLPHLEARARYFDEAFCDLDVVVIFNLEPIPFLLSAYPGKIGSRIDAMSRSELLDIRWLKVVERIIGTMPRTSILFTSTFSYIQRYSEIMSFLFSPIALDDICFPARLKNGPWNAPIGLLSELAARPASPSSTGGLSGSLLESISNGYFGKSIKDLSEQLDISEVLINEMFMVYFSDVEKIRQIDASNVCMDFLSLSSLNR